MLNYNSGIISESKVTEPVEFAVHALERDIKNTCRAMDEPGVMISLRMDPSLEEECFAVAKRETDGPGILEVRASGDLGFIYGIYHISKTFLGVPEFWFWNEYAFTAREGYEVPEGYEFRSRPFPVRFRGWFVNDEVLIDTWQIDGDPEKPWEMVFEALLRCGGNMTIPGTDENAHIYCELASRMGLWITHHHAEPLGAQMFARAYPELEASYDKHPDLFEGLWRAGIEKQKDYKVLWNLGFRGQGDRPFWADDPAYDTDEKRGRLMSDLIRKQYDLVKSYDPKAICCSNLYGETMELYQKGCLDLPEDVIFIWADNGFGRMVSRRQGNHNPRVYALPEQEGGRHGIYYHASFYDLQAAAQMVMLPNSPEFVVRELQKVYEKRASDYWIINCSNVKPHAYILALIAEQWKRREQVDVQAFLEGYCRTYYGEEGGAAAAELYALWPAYCPAYGPHEDDHAGEQFPNHGARVLATALITGYDKESPSATKAATEWLWFSGREMLAEQVREYLAVVEPALAGYEEYLEKCRKVDSEALEGNLIWQVDYLRQSYLGACHACRAILAMIEDQDPLQAFYEAGLAAEAFRIGYEHMRAAEHGVFAGYFENDCEADIRQSYYVMKGLMSFLRFCGDGPHFYKWQRMFQQGAGGDKVMLILRLRRHLTDEELWKLMRDGRPDKG